MEVPTPKREAATLAVAVVHLRYTQFNGSLDRQNGFKTGGNRNEARSFRGAIQDLETVAERFSEVTIECQPYYEVLDRFDYPDTLFYLDPPYYETSSDRDHYRVGGDFDHERFVDELCGREGDWIVSYQTLPPGLADIAETVETYTAMYSMSYDDGRQETTERLAMNYDPADHPRFTTSSQTTLADGVLARTEGGNSRSLRTGIDQSEGGEGSVE